MNEVPSKLIPGHLELIEHGDSHPERTPLPRFLEHELSVIARQRGVTSERRVDRRKAAPAVCQTRTGLLAFGSAVPIMQSRVTIAASSSSLQPSVPSGRIM